MEHLLALLLGSMCCWAAVSVPNRLRNVARKWMFTVGKTNRAARLYKACIWLSYPSDGIVSILRLPPALKPSFQSRQEYETCLMLLGRFSECAAMHKQDVKLLLERTGEDIYYAGALGRLAYLLLLTGEVGSADRLSAEATEIAEKSRRELKQGGDKLNQELNNLTILLCAETYFGRALIVDALERKEQVLECRTRAVNLANSISYEDAELDAFLTSYGMQLGEAYLTLENYEMAATLINKALDVRRRTLDTRNILRISGEATLGKLYCRTNRLEEAEPLLQMALDTMSWCPDYVQYLVEFALLRQKQGRMEQSRELYESALKLSETYFGADHPLLLNVLNPYLVLVRLEEDAKIERLLHDRCVRIRRKWGIVEPTAARTVTEPVT